MPTRDRSRSTDLYTSFYLGSRLFSARNLHLGMRFDVSSSFLFFVEEKNREKSGKSKLSRKRDFAENRDIGDIAIRTVPSLKRKKKISASSAVGLAGETRSRVARPRQVRSNKKEEIVAPKGVLHRLFSGYLFISRRSFEPSSLTNGVICVVHVKRERSLRLIYESRGSA